MDKRYFHDKVAEWYKINKRDLPWRETKDPYKIWLSEIILQQTRVNQGLPYYLRFVEKYPTVNDLADAAEQDILRLWQGLGYYTRARNLHKCAKEVASVYKGEFPASFETLKKLPGIGDYTAAAIASISFNERVAVVDGNVFRVLSRVFGIEAPINSPEGKKIFSTLANSIIRESEPDVFNQAIMEFGALFCSPKNPSCSVCPFQKKCFAATHALQSVLPIKLKSKASRKRYFYYAVFKKGNSLAMKKRIAKDIWNGLFDFNLIEKTRPVKIETLLMEDDLLKSIQTKSIEISETYKHVLSHQVISAKFIIFETSSRIKGLEYYPLDAIADLPKPVLISKFLSDFKFL